MTWIRVYYFVASVCLLRRKKKCYYPEKCNEIDDKLPIFTKKSSHDKHHN